MLDELDLRIKSLFEEDNSLPKALPGMYHYLVCIDVLKDDKATLSQVAAKMDLKRQHVKTKIDKALGYGLIRMEEKGYYVDIESNKKRYDERAKLYYLTDKGKIILGYLKQLYEKTPTPMSALVKMSEELRGTTKTKEARYNNEMIKKNKVKSKMAPEIPISAREFHSERIRYVIKKLIDEFPEVGEDNVYITSSRNLYLENRIIYLGQKLSVEDETLFSDIKNHIGTFIRYAEFEELFNKFKEKSKKFHENTEKIRELIIPDMKKLFGLIYSDRWDYMNMFHKNLVEWIYDGVKYLADEVRRKYFHEFYVKLSSKVEEMTRDGKTILEYWLEARGIIRIDKQECERYGFKKDNLKEDIDERLKRYMENLSKRPCYKEYINNKKLQVELKNLREEIVSKLKQEENRPIYEGNCEYLVATTDNSG
ncbi:MAG: hypothetical protein AB1779_05440 [Candidatus Thermoplasmatota archaeon]